MKSILLLVTSIICLASSFSLQAAEVLCKGAYVDTIAVEGRRSEASQIERSLVISFKDAQGNVHNCGGALQRYVYFKADGNDALLNAMMSIAFMARTNNYKVAYMINTGARIYSADELAYLQIVENTAIAELR